MKTLQVSLKKWKALDAHRKELAQEYPEETFWQKPTPTLDEIFIPYQTWLDSKTDEEKQKYKLIPDSNYDFTGIYIVEDYNDHHYIDSITDHTIKDKYNWNFGVCDNATQIIDNFTLSENAIVLMCPVFKADQSEMGGWRWKKWGKYYGIHQRKHEYLYDEEDIEMIYCFHIYEIDN